MIKNRFYLYLPIGVLFVLFILGTFLDLDIAKGLGANSNLFTVITAAFLPMIACSFVTFISMYLFSDSFFHQENKIKKWILIVIAIGVTVVALYASQKELISRDGLNVKHGYYISIPVSILFNGFAGIFGYNAGLKNENKKMYQLILLILGSFLLAIAFALIAKKIVHRLRFTLLIDEESAFTLDDYTPWYLSSSLYEGYTGDKWAFESFPSGHLAIVSSLFITVPFAVNCYERVKKYNSIIYVITLLLTYLMLFSRMYNGSHYLSDTALPGLICYIPYAVAYEIYFKNFRINPIESKDF